MNKKKKQEAKSYKINLAKKFEVTFVKDGVKFKKGDKTEVNLALASKFFQQGKIDCTPEIKEAAQKTGCEELFSVSPKKGGSTV